MRVPRIFHPTSLAAETTVALTDEAAQHVGKVLRMQVGQAVVLFNGDGYDYAADIVDVAKREVQVQINAKLPNQTESRLRIHLGQGISRGDRMDFVLQKSVELGVASITPLFTERCGVKLTGERLEKKRQQWQKIVNSACEQSGRAVVPEVCAPQALTDWLAQQPTASVCVTLDPRAPRALRELPLSSQQAVTLLIGPEGGLSEQEIQQAGVAEFTPVRLGPRVLRTETAALTALAVLQYEFGDLS